MPCSIMGWGHPQRAGDGSMTSSALAMTSLRTSGVGADPERSGQARGGSLPGPGCSSCSRAAPSPSVPWCPPPGPCSPDSLERVCRPRVPAKGGQNVLVPREKAHPCPPTPHHHRPRSPLAPPGWAQRQLLSPRCDPRGAAHPWARPALNQPTRAGGGGEANGKERANNCIFN